MKKMLKKIKNRAGLTLTEMLVTVAILSLFSAACLTGMTTALSVRRDNIMANDAEILASMVTNYITNELRTASNLRKVDGNKIEKEDETVTAVRYQSNESGFNDVSLGLDEDITTDEENGQLVMVINKKTGADEISHIFSEAAYSDKSVKRLRLLDLKFTPVFDSKGKMTSMTVTFDVGYKNVDTTDIVALPTARTVFTVGLMNYEAPDSGEPGPTGG